MKKIKVWIDPGHGGSDRYNRGPTKYIEADGVLTQSLYLEKALLRCKQFEVTLSRRTDAEAQDLDDRYPRFLADLSISMHTNAWRGITRGSVVFYSIHRPEDQKWAAKMSRAIASMYNVPDRGAKTRLHPTWANRDYYAIIRNAIAVNAKHAFLVETLFHDHPEDEKILLQDKELERTAETYAEIICEMFGVKYIAPTKSLIGINPEFTEAQKFVKSRKISDALNPTNPVERQQAWTMLMRAFKEDLPNFNNIKVEEYHMAKEWAKEPQMWVITNSISDGIYPGLSASREMVWTMFERTAKALNICKETAVDFQIAERASNWAKDAQIWVMSTKISDGSYPKREITREEFWTMIMRFIKYIKEDR